MATAKKLRGSELLARKWTERDLTSLVDLEHDGVSLVEFFPKGIPAPDGGWGTWHVKSDSLLKFLEKLLRHEKIPGIRIFPKGIPVVDQFDVNFTAGSAQER
jgi:hypothetical protein